MNCCVCGWPATGHAFVRPVAGGRRWPLFFCDNGCKQQKLAAIEPRGWIETTSVLGYDMLTPLEESRELPAELR